MLEQKQLLLFLGFMFSTILIGSGLNIFILSKIHYLGFKNNAYSNVFTIMTIGGLIGAVFLKNPKLQKFNNGKSLICAILVFSIVYLIFGNINNYSVFLASMLLFSFANTFFLVNMNTVCFNFISQNEELLKIAPIINGFTMTGFYAISFIGPLIYNILLQHGINFHLIVNTAAAAFIIVVSLFLLCIRKRILKI